MVSGSVPDPTPLTPIPPPPLRPRVHTYTGGHWPCRSVRKVPRALAVSGLAYVSTVLYFMVCTHNIFRPAAHASATAQLILKSRIFRGRSLGSAMISRSHVVGEGMSYLRVAYQCKARRCSEKKSHNRRSRIRRGSHLEGLLYT